MTARAIPFSEIKSVKQLFDDPEVQAMGMTEKVSTKKYAEGDRKHLEYPRNPVRYSRNELA